MEFEIDYAGRDRTVATKIPNKRIPHKNRAKACVLFFNLPARVPFGLSVY